MASSWQGPDWTDYPTGHKDAMRVRKVLTECIVEAFRVEEEGKKSECGF